MGGPKAIRAGEDGPVEPLYGTRAARLDDKFRLQIPSDWRLTIGPKALFTAGPDACLTVFSREGFDEARKEVDALSRADAEERERRRKYYAEIEHAMADKQGRVVVPPKLRGGLTPGQAVTLVGAGDATFELWDPQRFANREAVS